MNEKVLRTLEFYKMTDRLGELCGSAPGTQMAKDLVPMSDIGRIKAAQAETSDALARIYKKGSLSFSGIPNIGESVKRLMIGGSLTMAELLRICSILTATLRVRNYGCTDSDEDTADSLSERFSLLEPLPHIRHEIDRCIISEEDMADDASPGLKSVRRHIKVTNEKIREQLNSILTGTSTRSMLQDALITMRNGRYCLPVKQEYKSQFGGLLHDQSSSGSTAFIEPASVVRLNNELAELHSREKEEIEKVLAALSAMAAEHADGLKYDMDTLAEFDFIFAKASLSRQMKASEPQFNDRRYVNIKKGRHPLIDPRVVVPIDIYIGDEFDLLVITGPNTGGKTVTLKTVGLFTLMGQAGLHIPAFDGSQLALFDEVYADIGDEQSIEQSLSTFSSHMKNIVSILENADENTLALFDELGAGTDPTEGAALAMATLTYLHRQGIRTIATTHYSELKIFALSTKGVSNACCEFSMETLQPTYRLLIGIPGKSNAFAIAQKLGLQDHIIESAREFIGTRELSFEDVISNLETTRLAIEREKALSHEYMKEAEALRKTLAEKNDRIDRAKEKILNEAGENARKILMEAKDYADETIRKFNKLGLDGMSAREMELERSALRERLGETDARIYHRKKSRSASNAPGELKVGDAVNVLSLGMTGTVSTAPNAKGELYVQMGMLRSLVHIGDLEPVSEQGQGHIQAQKQDQEKKPIDISEGTHISKIKVNKTMNISTELNIVGKRVDEAMPIVDKYIDDAYLAHLPKVSIIHGRGTGALRDAVHRRLKKLKYVASYRVGGFGEGDHGVTYVEFKL